MSNVDRLGIKTEKCVNRFSEDELGYQYLAHLAGTGRIGIGTFLLAAPPTDPEVTPPKSVF